MSNPIAKHLSSDSGSLQISVEITLPFYSFTFGNDWARRFVESTYNGTTFELEIDRFDEDANFTDVVVNWRQSRPEGTLDDPFLEKMIRKAVEFLNFVIYHARAFDVETSNMPLISPRNIKSAILKIKSESGTQEKKMQLRDNPPEFFQEYLQGLNEPGAFDVFYEIVEKNKIDPKAVLPINLLVNAYHAIYEARYNESIINCLTAIEARTFPLLTKWLTQQLFSKGEKKAEEILIDLSSASKFELLFGAVYNSILESEEKLLEELKGINKLRNDIIHKGKSANGEEARRCLNISSKFLMLLKFGH